MTIPYRAMSTKELLNAAANSDNEMARELAKRVEAGTGASAALATALCEASTNVEEFLGNLTVIVRDEYLQVDDLHEKIMDIIENGDMPDGQVRKLLEIERKDFDAHLAKLWMLQVIDKREAETLKSELEDSLEDPGNWSDLPDFLDQRTNYDNPFQYILDEEAAKKKAAKEDNERKKAAKAAKK